MATVAVTSPSAVHEKIAKGPGLLGTVIFVAVLVVGVGYRLEPVTRPQCVARRFGAPVCPPRHSSLCGAGI